MMQYAGNAAILLAVLLTYTIDSKLHRQNIKVLRYCGGEELGRHLSRSFYKICYWFVAFAWIEQMFGLWDFPVELRIAGGVIFTICAFIRLWAMQSLGQLWSRHCIFVSGVKRVRSGPYRFLNHPEYLARVGEAVGFMLCLEALVTGIFLIPFLWISVLRLSKLEARQLDELSRQPLTEYHLT